MLAYDYPLLGLLWTMLGLFLWIAWLFLLFRIFGDIVRSRDLSGWSKAGWSMLVILLPLVGTVVYLGVRGGSMVDRDVDQARAQREALDAYIRTAAGSATPSHELSTLASLRQQGVLTEDEFVAQKMRLLS